MKVILYMAISADGFIAKKDGDSNWVSEIDSVEFEKKIKEIGCIIVGRKTFDQYHGELYPIKGATNIVLSNGKSIRDQDTISVKSPQEAIEEAEKKGYKSVLLIGGGTNNGSFMNEDLIDEVFLSVHPIILGDGIRLFERYNKGVNLTLIGIKQLDKGLIQQHYKVNK